jgi:hypothetical protein
MIYILTVARYSTGLVVQIQWLGENGYSALRGHGPRSDVRFLVRYLFLEIPSQRKKLLGALQLNKFWTATRGLTNSIFRIF